MNRCRLTFARMVLPVLILVFIPSFLQAQNHYWFQQYGPRSSLLGGAVIGGVRDNSALFYNPGALGFIENPHLSVSANTYGMDILDLKNAAGKGLDLQSVRPYIYPQLLAGFINVLKVPNLKVGYGLITRYNTSMRLLAFNQKYYDVIPEVPGDELYRGRIEFDLNSQSVWGGIAVAYKFNKVFSLGLTTFVSYLHLDDQLMTDFSADVSDSTGNYETQVQAHSTHTVDNFSVIWKLGAAFDFKNFKMGLTFTAPSVNVFGGGRMSRSVVAYNVNRYLPPTVPFAKHPTYLLADDQVDLLAQYKNPFSIGFGFEYWFKRTKVSLAGEYFFPIEQYEVMRGIDQAIIRPAEDFGGDTVLNFMYATTGTVGVFNAALGIEQKLNDKFDICFGFRSDLNNTINLLEGQGVNGTSLNPSFWHYVHFSLGTIIHRGPSDISLGFNYGLGITKQRKQIINMSDPQGSNLLQGQQDLSMTANVHTISLVLGYTYHVKKAARIPSE